VVKTTDELRAHLAETRRRGYATAIEEGEAGTVALAAAFRAWDAGDAPVVGTVSIAGPLLRLGRERRDALAPKLIAASRALSMIWPVHRRRRSGAIAAVPRAAQRARAA
jgi:DNA-binding IclR family transcriptional regulator